MKKFKQTMRPQVKGKFIFVGQKKLYIKGVTYGTFRPNDKGKLYPEPKVVQQDFAQMAKNGINSIRTYTIPPLWLLDLAQEHGLYVMVGLPWEQHICFLDQPKLWRDIEERVRDGARICCQHPALLCYAIGNEIPASIVRWHGPRRVENFLKRLYRIVKAEDPESLVTYVNYPTTEYLKLPFIDFVCFNVYLESPDRLQAYLARLQNLAGDRPLVMAEIGLDSLRNGQELQAQTLDWQVRTTFEAGCAGCFVFAWTDEWYRGGFEIEDWDFGLTDRQRHPKPSLQAVAQAFRTAPFPADISWPRISVAVCTYNGASTIRDTLEAMQYLDYPDYEVIVVDDGSSDGVADIAKEYDVRLIVHPENMGLSSARNTALLAATGKIIAYIDDDAYPDPHWLTYLAATLLKGDWAGVGGPNIPPPGDGAIADCVANAPGGPVHVLLSDREAEHIPGCNMAYWVDRLKAIGGFDPRFRSAGDDVDICWRLQDRDGKIGFSPAAVVWHHRRNCVKTYWKQQKGYGKAEALLEEKWPERYNSAGHLSWAGRLYGKGLVQMLPFQQQKIYHGTWGSALFQSLYQPSPNNLLAALPTMPEWYLLALLPAGLSALGLFWKPTLLALPLFIAAVTIPLVQAIWSASQAIFTTPQLSRLDRFKLYGLTSLLYLMQPLARLWGRLENGLTPWRRRGNGQLHWPVPRRETIWYESWKSPEQYLSEFLKVLQQQKAIVIHGGDFDRWDLEIRGGLAGCVRILMTIEEHGGGKQLIRLRAWPRIALMALVMFFLLTILLSYAVWDQAFVPAMLLSIVTLGFGLSLLKDCAIASASYVEAVEKIKEKEPQKEDLELPVKYQYCSVRVENVTVREK